MKTVLDELNIHNQKLTSHEIGAGFTLKDRFVLDSVAGTGGMGTVYKARDKRKEEAGIKNSFVAIKIVNDQYKNHPHVFQTLQMEATKAQALAHPNIVRIYDFDRDHDIAFITMEYLEGRTLKQILETSALQTLSQAQKIVLISEISAALIYMHQQGYAHADLKPSNIFITNNLHVKLIDFGFSSTALTHDTDTVLTYSPLYASYEILNGKPASNADDVYGLACVSYELLGGSHPYQKKNAQQANDEKLKVLPIKSLHKYQWKCLEKALAIKSHDRYASVEQFMSDFNQSEMKFLRRLVHQLLR
jgi:serine/threonine protein kinase